MQCKARLGLSKYGCQFTYISDGILANDVGNMARLEGGGVIPL
jgi:hypothetical protein